MPDDASVAIATQLRDRDGWEQLAGAPRPAYRTDGMTVRYFEDWHLELENVADTFDDPDCIVFVSRHAGETGPLLTTHVPGNVAGAEYGGNPRSVPAAAPAALRHVYHALRDSAPAGYEVGIECTHHGPSDVGAPCLFVEVGSGPEQWADETAARAIADAVYGLRSADLGRSEHILLGIGGGHYAPRFERLLRETGWRVGHIAPDWALDELTDEATTRTVLDRLFSASGARLALLDGEGKALAELVDALGYRVVSETWCREVDWVSLEVVAAIEDRLGAIDEGVRLGDRIDVQPTTLEARTLSNELVGELQAADREGAIAAIAAVVTAYRTTENGNRLTGAVLVPETLLEETIVEAIEPILSERYPTMSWQDGRVTIEEERFDPGLAAKRGVPEGPAFGRLANGESVTVDGKEITPESVSRVVRRELSVLDD